jgi:pimeloyl-ACP methyl ester carboxylesterase
MNLILIPGFWLDGASWDAVAEPLRAAGHTVHALTLPGLESRDADRADIGLRDQVDAVIAAVDALAGSGDVVLVGHSAGGAIAHAVADARPDAITRVVYVDSGPLGDGEVINDELPVVDGEVPLPDWSVFEDADLIDLTDELRARFIAIAIPEPARVTSDPQSLSDPRRYTMPSTIICCEFTSEQLRGWVAKGYMPELALMQNYDLVDLPTGHWPQFTRPADLAEAILVAVA